MKHSLAYQPSLFDLLQVEKKQAVVLDIKEGKRKRDAGIDKATANANEKMPGWSDKAYLFLLSFLNNHNGPFMAEDVRSYAALLDFELPPHNRAWGGVMVRAAKNGIIVRCGISKVKNKKAHCANAAMWRQVKKHEV